LPGAGREIVKESCPTEPSTPQSVQGSCHATMAFCSVALFGLVFFLGWVLSFTEQFANMSEKEVSTPSPFFSFLTDGDGK